MGAQTRRRWLLSGFRCECTGIEQSSWQPVWAFGKKVCIVGTHNVASAHAFHSRWCLGLAGRQRQTAEGWRCWAQGTVSRHLLFVVPRLEVPDCLVGYGQCPPPRLINMQQMVKSSCLATIHSQHNEDSQLTGSEYTSDSSPTRPIEPTQWGQPSPTRPSPLLQGTVPALIPYSFKCCSNGRCTKQCHYR